MAKVAVIIGHSAKKQGAVNAASGVTEYDFNSRLAALVSLIINQTKHTAEIVERGMFYSALPRKVNKTNADIAISLHANAFDGRDHGTETLFCSGSARGRELARFLQSEVVACLGLSDRGVKPTHRKGRGGLLLHKTRMPCILAEPFFIDCDASLQLAEEKMIDLAYAYARGINKYLELYHDNEQ